MKYMVWNNKGGVGKTFLTYLLATEYAKANTDTDVVVVDMCPQANVSEMILGGNGKGEENLEKCHLNGLTIADYIKDRYNRSKFSKTGAELKYFIKAQEYNPAMPGNLVLVPGDIDLDICSTIINYLAQAPEKNAWFKSRKLLMDLMESIEAERSKKRKLTFFFDCNPSFANYTEMAVLAADRLIIPCTADSASIRGIHNLFRMVYGVEVIPENHTYDDSIFDTFISKAKEINLTLPKVHLFIQNKSRSLDKEATRAFKSHIQHIDKIVGDAKQKNPDCFSDNENLIINVKDGNTLASVANHTGLPLSDIKPAKYDIYGNETQTSKPQIDALLQNVKECVAIL
jgi:cellulose biosynthesis protein BcsQ